MLTGIDTFIAGIYCSIEELHQRELQRKDREPGNAERSSKKVHMNMIYDIEVDTTKSDADTCAKLIIDFVSDKEPNAFIEMSGLHDIGQLLIHGG
ncbi:MAG: hypothetical protein HN368_04510 [Spirochaetales bacterium]|jgi:chloramphenicol 3-O phosphotransferase|nr:hypothetical protein [Spirochaetales bacterium]